MLPVSSEVTFRKNLEGSSTHGLGPPSNSISFEEPRVTTATEEGSTAWRKKGRLSIVFGGGDQTMLSTQKAGPHPSWVGLPGKPCNLFEI